LVEYTVEVVYDVVCCPLLLDVTDGVETTPPLEADPEDDDVGATVVPFWYGGMLVPEGVPERLVGPLVPVERLIVEE